MSTPVKVLLVDDHRMMRQGLRSLIDEDPGLTVVAEADNGRQALEAVRAGDVDLVITDVGMPDLNGIEAARAILSLKPNVKILALSMHADRRFVAEMLRAGARGYILKEGAYDELHEAVREVMAGRTYLSPPVAGVTTEQDTVPRNSAYTTLTPREREVLRLMAEGYATKQVALKLKVSVKTVETHRRQIMNKLDLYSVAELTKYAIREGLTTIDLVSTAP
jgi:DNA-binding NarL/FixJ family response regulator